MHKLAHGGSDLICSQRPSIRLSHSQTNKHCQPTDIWHVCVDTTFVTFPDHGVWYTIDPFCRLHVMKHQRDRVWFTIHTLNLGCHFFYEFVFQNVVISQSNWWPCIYTCKLTICLVPFHDLQVQPCDNRARVALSGTSLRKQNWAIYTNRRRPSTDLSISFTQDQSPTIYLDICTEDYRRVDTIRYADRWTVWNLLPQIIYR